MWPAELNYIQCGKQNPGCLNNISNIPEDLGRMNQLILNFQRLHGHCNVYQVPGVRGV